MSNYRVVFSFIACVFIFLGATFSANGGGGDFVGNGGGLGEQNAVFTWMKLRSLLQSCTKDSLCQLTELERSQIDAILDIPSIGTARGIEFKSAEKEPEFFRRPGSDQIRILNTSPVVGSVIYANIDLIYSEDELGELIPLPVLEFVPLFIGELAYQLGISPEHTSLLQTKIVNGLSVPFTETFFLTYRKLYPLHFKAYRISDRDMTLALSDGHDVFDVDGLIRQGMPCMDLGGFLGVSELELRNVRWESNLRRSGEFDPVEGKEFFWLTLHASVQFTCAYEARNSRFRGNVSVAFSFRMLEGVISSITMDPLPVKVQYFQERMRVFPQNVRAIP